MTSLSQIHKLENRYPFDEQELEILLRCHADLLVTTKGGSFLNKLAHCSPYAFFFLPGDEIGNRVNLVETKILPPRFGEKLKEAIFADAFPQFANEGEEKALETFLEGVADCGRRGPREALRVLFDCCNEENNAEVEVKELVDLCFRLSVASEIIVVPTVDDAALNARLNSGSSSAALAKSLAEFSGTKETVSRSTFIEWSNSMMPLFASALSTFVHNIIFHGKQFPAGRTPYLRPTLDHASDIFESSDSPLLFPLGCMTPKMGGKWHRLYSLEANGASFNRMEWSVLGYDGPTAILINTEGGSTLGAFASSQWRESHEFFGDSDSFVFQLDPTVAVFRPIGKDSNYMYCNPSWAHGNDTHPHGMGFGGTLDSPRLFISEDFNTCMAGYLDSTYQQGDLLPKEALEKFQIKALEVWGVGGDEVVSKALSARDEHREMTDSIIYKSRVIVDKSGFLGDLQSGLIDTKVYQHRDQTRGRAEFTVDEAHHGYKLERKEGETVPFPLH
uniref:Oxidation resistance protein 1 n=1 Tax=Pseudictyota dubia TaxID=2749911 RepID=A0A7R9W6W9_9STRA|mmetsp:Transcript_365/g.441  ORF Transcript_365/g.441 Transcript_365/m.441 type:complete len:504 (+) Transcript_365:87-1598(+)